MKKQKGLLLLLSALLGCIIPQALGFSDVVIESRVSGTTFGFPNSREESDTDINAKILTDVFVRVSTPVLENLTLNTGYKYSSIFQSQLFASLHFVKKNIDVEGGLSLGFFNELPLITVPGISGKTTVQLLRKFIFTLYGNSSFFLRPLFALSTREYDFDQNLVGFSSAFQNADIRAGISYEKENLYVKTSDTAYRSNTKKYYEINISTRFQDFWLNSQTGLGGELADFSTPTAHQRILGIYIKEVVILAIKKTEISVGLKTYIFRFPLKDLADLSVSSSLSLALFSGMKLAL